MQPTTDGSAAPDRDLLERLTRAVVEKCMTVLDETDIANVVEAVYPVAVEQGVAEYDRGLQAGDYFARQKVAHRLGLGDVKP